jgi:penicillin-binding protein 1A
MRQLWLLAAIIPLLPSGVAIAQDCPTMAAFRRYNPPEATRVFALDGSRIADLSPERRVVVPLSEVPLVVSRGIIAVEDRRFFQHDGVDLRGVGRAVVRNLRSLSLEEGFSTITMQLARNVFPVELPRADKLRRKVCEVQLAKAIEAQYTKQQILERYLNQVYLGDGLYGVEEAARAYFGKAVRAVTLPEAALLIGLVKNPEGYNPRKHATRAIQRRNVVLEVMERELVVSAATADTARRAPLRLAAPLEAAGAAPWFVAAIRRELRSRFGDSAHIRGLRVYTGLEPAVQRAAAEALRAQIARVERGELGRYRNPVPGRQLTPAEGAGSPYLQGMVIVLDAASGEIRALVGGRDFTHSSYDRALSARRQPGSAFKPIVYAAALRDGLTAGDRIETTPLAIPIAGTVAWRPDDLVPDSVTSLSIRDALALSSNNGAVRVGQWVGTERVTDMARTLGISSPIPAFPAIFLGAAEVNPAELAAAYAAFANGGYLVEPGLIRRVEDARGKVLWRAPALRRQVIDPGVAWIITSMLQDAVDRGTGQAVRRLGFAQPAAGKTGTSNGAHDVWFVGMTPELVAAVWLGFDQPRTILPNAFGGNLAAPVWTDVMKTAYRARSAPAWATPEHLVAVTIDPRSGLLPAPGCPTDSLRIEYYLPGTEPLENCTAHNGSSRRR